MITLPPMPATIAVLPRDERGYPVPWFVQWIEGKPEFRIADASKLRLAIRDDLCWVCGQKMTGFRAFVIGPMCMVNRTSAEPPCHIPCAEFSAKACPFLTKPKAQRREAGLPEDAVEAAGCAIKRNPGVTLVYICRGYNLMGVENGVLFRPLKPVETHWYCEGRPATRSEVLESMESGFPILHKMAVEEGPDAEQELQRMYEIAKSFLPA